jgi:hypothetical protein
MNTPVTIAGAFVRAWVAIYTRGLPEPVRSERIAEIASDLWDHQQGATVGNAARAGTALQVFLRLVLGAPSDMAWHVETRAAVRSRKERGMKAPSWNQHAFWNAGQAEKVFLACVGLLVIYQAAAVAIGLGFALGLWGGSEEGPGSGWFVTIPPSAAGLVFIWAGLRARIAAPLKSGVLIALGVLPSILMFWMMLPPVVALGVAIYAILHGRSEHRRLGTRG